MTATPETAARTYEVRTYGCQMNVHDSERLTGLLEDAGYVAAASDEQPDVVVFNTCAVRENADNKLYGNLGHLAPVKAAKPGMQIAVGGCLAQKDRGEITRRAPWVDVVFGTHNIGSLPVLLERARVQQEAQVEILESLEVFPSTLPTKRESAYAAWVSISVGLQQHLHVLHRPGAARQGEGPPTRATILAEVEALVDEGVIEVTLLGQNVNSYGVEFGDRLAFGKLLRACGEIDGLERVRFTSPHPKDFTDDVIAAMAETPNVMPQPAHAAAVRLGQGAQGRCAGPTGSEKYLGIIDRVRAAMPDAAITTDIIVGFPGETEEDFLETMKVVERARFSGAFTFQYSKRPGTPAAVLEDQVPKAVVQERYERLVALVNDIAWDENKRLVGTHRRAAGRRGRGAQGRADPPAVRPRPRQPAGALHRGRRRRPPGRRTPRRHGRGRRHVRRPAPPRRRQRRPERTADPGRRRLGGAHVRAEAAGRLARPAHGRRARPAARGDRLRRQRRLRASHAGRGASSRASEPPSRGPRGLEALALADGASTSGWRLNQRARLEPEGHDRGSAAGTDGLQHLELVGDDRVGQRVEVEPPEVGGLLGLHDPRLALPGRRSEEVVDPLVDGGVVGLGALHRAPGLEGDAR